MAQKVCPICTGFDKENLGMSMDIVIVFTGRNWKSRREAGADLLAIKEALGMTEEEFQGLLEAYPNPPIVAVFPAECREAAEALAATPGLALAGRHLLEESDLVSRARRWAHMYEEANDAVLEVFTSPNRS